MPSNGSGSASSKPSALDKAIAQTSKNAQDYNLGQQGIVTGSAWNIAGVTDQKK